MAKPGKWHIIIQKNRDFIQVFKFTGSITGHSYTATIFENSSDTVIDTFTVTVDTSPKTVTLALTYTETDALTVGNYRYEVAETASGLKQTIIVGRCAVVYPAEL